MHMCTVPDISLTLCRPTSKGTVLSSNTEFAKTPLTLDKRISNTNKGQALKQLEHPILPQLQVTASG